MKVTIDKNGYRVCVEVADTALRYETMDPIYHATEQALRAMDDHEKNIGMTNVKSAYKNVIFRDRSMAEGALAILRSTIENYGSATVQDLYDCTDMNSYSAADGIFGWTDLSTAYVMVDGLGYKLYLPTPHKIK